MLELEKVNVSDMRKAVRHFIPNERGVSGLGNVGTRTALIQALEASGVMPVEVEEFLAGAKNIPAPVDQGQGFKAKEAADLIAQAQGSTEQGQQQEPAQEQPAEKTESNSPAPSKQQEQKKEDDEQDELGIIRKIITKDVTAQIKQALEERQNQQQPAPEVDEEKVTEIVKSELKKFKKDMVKVIEVKQPEGLPNKAVGLCHRETEKIAKVAALRLNSMLVGPAGGGKTTCCEKVSEILNLKFYPMSVGPQTTKSDLLGYKDAVGNYHSTPLREAFEKGGLLLIDEMDAANAGVMTIANALLANGYCSFPDAVIKKHDDFVCITACNTFGRGADRQYVGRNQLDAATLDRFVVIDFDYDDDLERALSGNNDWVEKVQAYRKRAWGTRQRVVISPRASIFGARLLAAGFPQNQVEELVIWKGVSPEIKSKIKG